MFEKKTKKRKKKKKGGFKHSFLKLKIRLLKPKVHVCLKMSTKKKKKIYKTRYIFHFCLIKDYMITTWMKIASS